MATHPKDTKSNNPRVQCSVCGEWKRQHAKVNGETVNLFYGSCRSNEGGDHLAGDRKDVCSKCCDRDCASIDGEDVL